MLSSALAVRRAPGTNHSDLISRSAKVKHLLTAIDAATLCPGHADAPLLRDFLRVLSVAHTVVPVAAAMCFGPTLIALEEQEGDKEGPPSGIVYQARADTKDGHILVLSMGTCWYSAWACAGTKHGHVLAESPDEGALVIAAKVLRV
eukprot:2568081-Rhodomonas_salina.1